jgi:dipeptidyl aminopeptidase/acylaminoacyl peptidase
MNRIIKNLPYLTYFSFLIIISNFSIASEKVPHNFFSRLPAYEHVSLSPDGKKVAFVENLQKPMGVALLKVFDLSEQRMITLLQSDNKKVKIKWFKWANTKVLMISAAYEAKSSSVRYYQTRLFSADISDEDAELTQMLKQTRSRAGIRGGRHTSQFQDSVVDWLPDEDDYILMQADLDVQSHPDIYRVNINNGRSKRIERGKQKIRYWYTDQQGKPRIGRSIDYDDGYIRYLHKTDKDSEWEELFAYTTFDDKPVNILGFSADPNILYYLKYIGNYKALHRMSLDKKESEVVLQHDGYDVSGRLIYSKITNDAIGISDIHSKFGRFYFDEKHYALHVALDQVVPNKFNKIVDLSHDENIYILYSQADNSPGQYFYGDRKNNKLSLLFSKYPELDNVELPGHETISYKARDGVEIEALVTLPLHGEKPYPTIIHPHGGPGARDTKGFDPWVAYLAHQGYAVIRPNFRGSTGYGYEFAQAQMGRWGLEMQDDITDALTHFVATGIANPKKVCIFGASYGGYAAKMATVKTPDLFSCAVSFAGVSDLNRLARTQRRYLGGERSAEKQLGDESDDLNARSPISNIKKIKTPLLIMHGADDIIVDVKQSREFAEELEDESKNFKYVEFEYGDHYLSIQQNRYMFFVELEKFLNEHIGN